MPSILTESDQLRKRLEGIYKHSSIFIIQIYIKWHFDAFCPSFALEIHHRISIDIEGLTSFVTCNHLHCSESFVKPVVT